MNTSRSKSVKRKKARTGTTSESHLDFRASREYYGFLRGKILEGGNKNPVLYKLQEAKDEAAILRECGVKFKVVKIRMTYEVISEVIL